MREAPDTLAAALAYAARGWPVFPVHTPSADGAACSCGVRLADDPKHSAGKHPRTREGVKDATTDEGRIREWWSRWPDANIGIGAGRAAGWWVLDVDGDEGIATLRGLEAKHGELPETMIATTGSGGWHFLFRFRPDRPLGNWKDAGGLDCIDVRTEGGYIVAAPSLHASGQRYDWCGDVPIVDAPAWLLDAVDPPKPPRPAYVPPPTTEARNREEQWCRGALQRMCERVARLADGRRAALLKDGYEIGGYVGAGLLHRDHAEEALIAAGEASGTRHNVPKVVRYALETGMAAPLRPVLEDRAQRIADEVNRQRNRPDEEAEQVAADPVDLTVQAQTDLGNAERLQAVHGRDMRYSEERWYLWTGRGWAEDRTQIADVRASEVIRQTYGQAAALVKMAKAKLAAAKAKDDQEAIDRAAAEVAVAESLRGHARRSESDGRLTAMVRRFGKLHGVTVVPDVWDRDSWSLNVGNGTVDLRTGDLRPHRQEDMNRHLMDVEYCAEAGCPTWRGFLARIFGADSTDEAKAAEGRELVAFVQRVVGYSLTGDVREQLLFVLHGEGRNGKSTFLGTLLKLAGPYGWSGAPGLLVERKGEAHLTEVAELCGRRLVSCVEIEAGQFLAEARVKALTGGDPQNANFMHSDHFTFDPTHKLLLAVNHKPRVRSSDLGIWRRLCLIPFEVTIPESEVDQALPDKLVAELPGILAWAVEGARDWHAGGLRKPAVVVAASNAYRGEMDRIGDFLTDWCDSGIEHSESASLLHRAYEVWCRECGEAAPVSLTRFGDLLTQRRFAKAKTGGRIVRKGLRLNATGRAELEQAEARRREGQRESSEDLAARNGTPFTLHVPEAPNGTR